LIRTKIIIYESNFANSLDGVFDKVFGDFRDLSLAVFDIVSFNETLIGLSGYVHEFKLEWFHDVLNFFRLFLCADYELINVVDIFFEALIYSTCEFVIDDRL
jgi:hypothetical protein